MKDKINVYDIINEKIIAELDKGIIPWEKSWVNTSGIFSALSHDSGKRYSILNQMLIGMPGEYLTYKQAQAEGGHIKKGAKSQVIVFYKPLVKDAKDKEGKPIVDEEGNPKKIVIPMLRYWNVFHIDDAEGIERKYGSKDIPKFNNETIPEIEKLVKEYLERTGVTLRHYEQDRSYYAPADDEIILPHMNQFKTTEQYYHALFHEMAHSTGIKSRLNRDLSGRFDSDSYSKEELVAEITSAVLCNQFGIDTTKVHENNLAYIRGWSKRFKEDNKVIVQAATKAEKAVKYILNQNDETEETEEKRSKTMNIKIINQYSKEIPFNTAVQFMDDELRETIHSIADEMSEQEFFDRYSELHREKFGEEFFLNTPNPQY